VIEGVGLMVSRKQRKVKEGVRVRYTSPKVMPPVTYFLQLGPTYSSF
jgi:hypothetical protein